MSLRQIDLGRVRLLSPVLLAPMAGVTDAPFRLQAQAFGARYTVSEMVAGEQLAQARPDVVRRASGAGRISPLVIQLAGREPRWMRLGAQLAEEAGADVVDINMGCPAKRVTTGLSGSALMRDVDQALSIIEATVSGTALPVSLKMRLGWDEAQINAPEIARRAEGAGVRMIVIHGRTRNQFYSGAANWDAIRAVTEAVSIPVIANGDIKSVEDARRCLALSGAAGIMIGRATQGRPWLVGAVARALETGAPLRAPPAESLYESLCALYEDSLRHYGLALGLRVARKHLSWTIETSLPRLDAQFRRAERARLCALESPDEVRAGLARLFDLDHERAAAGNPRSPRLDRVASRRRLACRRTPI